MKRRQFTREFKQEAARMLIIEGLSAKEVSAQNLLYRWKQEHIDDLEASKPEGAQSPKEMALRLGRAGFQQQGYQGYRTRMFLSRPML